MRKTRILLVSDVHYTTEETAKELKEIYPEAIGSLANGKILGYTQKERMDFLVEALQKEHEKAPVDAILMPGDLSIDDYDFRKLPDNYCIRFRDDVLSRFPAPTYIIPGNHDSYPNEIWEGIFGRPRQFSVVINGVLFLMADTYNAPVNKASGSPYTPFDIPWAKGEMEKYPDLPVFILAHYIRRDIEPAAFAEFVKNNTRIKGFFVGHSHKFENIDLGEAYGHKPMYDIGAFSYYTHPIDGKWDFNVFVEGWRWGYQMLEFDAETYTTRHIFLPMQYHAGNGDFDMPYKEEGFVEAPLR